MKCRFFDKFRSLVFGLMGGLVLSTVVFFAQTGEAAAASLTLSLPSKALAASLDPNADSGFGKASANINLTTDANWGYELSVKAKDDNTLKNGANSLASITAAIDENTFKSGAEYNNKWGFKPSKLNGTTNTNFLAAPTTAATVIEKATAPSPAPTAYAIEIGAKADSTLATGTYSNSFTFTATVNTVSYNITYNLNSGTWSGTSPQTGSTPEESITLDENTPSRDGFEFLGWCTNADGGEDCAGGTKYDPGDTYELTEGDNVVNLYAMWHQTKVELLTSLVTVDPGVTQITFKVGSGIEMIMVGDPTKNSTNYWRPSYAFSGTDVVMPVSGGEKIVVSVTPKSGNTLTGWTKTTGNTQTWTANGSTGSYKAMKDVTHAECIAAGEEGMNVTDERNGVSYTIGKFADRCWMFSNLRLEPGKTLTPTDSDVTSNFTLPSQADSDAWTSSSQNYYSKKSMKVCKGAAGYTSSGNGGAKCTDQTIGVTEYYYNWYTAIANDAVGSSPTSSSSATTSLDSQAKGSICPKNWHLHQMPSGSSDVNDLTTVWNAAPADNPGRLVASGYFYSGTQYNVGNNAYWWSSTRVSDYYARRLYLGSGSAYGSSNNKYLGFSVRCEL